MKILLVRADGLGDALVCAPLVAALRDAGHELGAVLSMANREVFAPGTFAHVHVVERIPWPEHGSTPASRVAALSAIRAVGYDVALVASEEIDAYALASEAAIPRRVGFVSGWEKPLKTIKVRGMLTEAILRPASAERATGHEVETLFRLGAGLHAESSPTRDLARLRKLILAQRVRPSNYIAVQVSAKNEGSGLDGDTYIALARSLTQSRFEVMLLGDESALLTKISRASAVMADGMLGVPDWKERIAAARALVTPDSGAAHVAGMIGVPTIDCFVGSATANYDVRRWAPWAAPHRALVLAPAAPDFMAGALARELYDLLDTLAKPVETGPEG